MLAMALPFLVVFPAVAEAHLFHTVFELRDNQLTKDSLLVLRLVEFPDENFAMAEAVYLGEQRLRLKPGGFRTWLRRPLEPGMVFKADYQMHRWSGSVETAGPWHAIAPGLQGLDERAERGYRSEDVT